MKLELARPRTGSPASRWTTTTSAPKISGTARRTTTSARTSRRCCSTSRARHPSPYSISAAGRGATSKCSPRSATSRSAWKAQPASPRWRAPTAAAKCGSRTSSSSICRTSRFDGVFANAALFHVPSQELPRVLLELHATLKPGGVLFSSNPHGHNEEGWNRGRYGAYHDLERWRRYLSAAGFAELAHYYRPAGLPRERQPWLASVWRRLA